MRKIFKKKYTNFRKCLIEIKYDFELENTGFVPQGVCAIDDKIVVACYDGNGNNNSILLVFDQDNKKMLFLDSKIHCGGICYHKKTDSFFITGKGKGEKAFINRYCGKDIVSAKEKSIIVVDKILCVDEVGELYSTAAKHSSVAFINCYENNVILGNFINYKSDKKGTIKKYRCLNNGELSVYYSRLSNPYSDTQGICIFKFNGEEYYAISRSFGRNRNSILNIAKLNNNSFQNFSTIVMPCMAQQVSIIDGKMAVVFESCADKYRDTALSNSNGVYFLDLSKLLTCNDTFKDFCRGDKLFIDNKGIKMY